jgi:hypothetical protein
MGSACVSGRRKNVDSDGGASNSSGGNSTPRSNVAADIKETVTPKEHTEEEKTDHDDDDDVDESSAHANSTSSRRSSADNGQDGDDDDASLCKSDRDSGDIEEDHQINKEEEDQETAAALDDVVRIDDESERNLEMEKSNVSSRSSSSSSLSKRDEEEQKEEATTTKTVASVSLQLDNVVVQKTDVKSLLTRVNECFAGVESFTVMAGDGKLLFTSESDDAKIEQLMNVFEKVRSTAAEFGATLDESLWRVLHVHFADRLFSAYALDENYSFLLFYSSPSFDLVEADHKMLHTSMQLAEHFLEPSESQLSESSSDFDSF